MSKGGPRDGQGMVREKRGEEGGRGARKSDFFFNRKILPCLDDKLSAAAPRGNLFFSPGTPETNTKVRKVDTPYFFSRGRWWEGRGGLASSGGS
jgi:hypothetical protein